MIANYALFIPIRQDSVSATAISYRIYKFLSNRISSPSVHPMLTRPTKCWVCYDKVVRWSSGY